MNTCRLLSLITVTSTFVALGSCSSVLKHTAYEQYTAETAIIQAPLIADLEADPARKVSATYRAVGSTETEAKRGALYEAMKQGGCDVVLQPVFEIKTYPKVIEANVSGICARYKAIRKPNLEDVTLMQELKDAMPLFNPDALEAEKRQSFLKAR